jgi:hypothetical protein
VIICAARTGSSHFVSALGGHPDVFVNGNIFDAARRKRLYVFWPKEDVTPAIRNELIRLRTNNPEAFLERMYTTNYDRTHVGFKIFEGENDTILDKIIMDKSIRKVVLYRRNILATFSSALIARETGQYGLRDETARAETQPVKFVAEKFVKFHDKYTSFIASVTDRLKDSDQHYQLVNYEDVNEPHVLSNTIAFIGGNSSKHFSRDLQYKTQVKQNSFDIISRFANPRAVEKFLRNHNLLHWQHEGELELGRKFSRNRQNDGASPAVDDPQPKPQVD